MNLYLCYSELITSVNDRYDDLEILFDEIIHFYEQKKKFAIDSIEKFSKEMDPKQTSLISKSLSSNYFSSPSTSTIASEIILDQREKHEIYQMITSNQTGRILEEFRRNKRKNQINTIRNGKGIHDVIGDDDQIDTHDGGSERKRKSALDSRSPIEISFLLLIENDLILFKYVFDQLISELIRSHIGSEANLYRFLMPIYREFIQRIMILMTNVEHNDFDDYDDDNDNDHRKRSMMKTEDDLDNGNRNCKHSKHQRKQYPLSSLSMSTSVSDAIGEWIENLSNRFLKPNDYY